METDGKTMTLTWEHTSPDPGPQTRYTSIQGRVRGGCFRAMTTRTDGISLWNLCPLWGHIARGETLTLDLPQFGVICPQGVKQLLGPACGQYY